MKRLVLAFALTGLMSMTVLAGEVPTNGAPAPRLPRNNNVKHGQLIEHSACYGDTHRAWPEIDH